MKDGKEEDLTDLGQCFTLNCTAGSPAGKRNTRHWIEQEPQGQDIIGVQVELDYVQFVTVVKYATGSVIRKSR